ncbi:DNA polymerase Y family protein [Salinibacterium sp. G-O1]|uniref:DNA polymerase Y family protein n=1 Tax=Salinibacterium sp. G-O1 TaxID=3046208 RepID=UPI0024B9B5D6|nr:DNA polymerase Y family protein [Salinibacterium sp. G-O1]MDJ0335087.1 DNA polymerase Y family protein [Salinibacterium sp. G-O1]
MTWEPPRVALLWCPDWPVTAAAQHAKLPVDAAIALVSNGVVHASSAAARVEGIRRGLRLREAQARHPELAVLDYDAALDNRAFEPIITALESLVPGVQVLRPGLCAVRVRGAARYYGGELSAGLFLAGRADDEGAGGARVGIADGIFTADQAARRTGAQGKDTVHVVAAGHSADFLAPLGIGLLDDQQGPEGAAAIVTLLRRLGIRTLGDFAALPADDVTARFGSTGARLHALASGRDSWPVTPRTPPRDLDVTVDFEPALERVDQVAFGVRAAAERFILDITAAKLVCTAIRVELDSDSGELSERVWLHPRSFTAGDVVDRVRWQLQGSGEVGLSSGITRVLVSPDAVDAIGNHESGLWGQGPDERIHHGLSRVQSMLGHGAVLMPGVGGGRTLRDRQQFVAWGDRLVGDRPAEQPWPGQLPTPLPGTVFSPRHPVHVFSGSGDSVSVDERGALSATPAMFSATGTPSRTLTAWAGPWPIDERWWSEDATNAWRFQAVDETGCAWLLVLDAGGWWAEARYD